MNPTSKIIDDRRKVLGMNQVELCIKAGVPPETYTRILKPNRRAPKITVLKRLCVPLGLDPDTLEVLPLPPKPFPIEKLKAWMEAEFATDDLLLDDLAGDQNAYREVQLGEQTRRIVFDKILELEKESSQ